jgi:hypothetical protein
VKEREASRWSGWTKKCPSLRGEIRKRIKGSGGKVGSCQIKSPSLQIIRLSASTT